MPAATLLRQLPGRALVVGSGDVVHVHATDERSRCGAAVAIEAELVVDVDQAPAVRVCARCLGSLPRADVAMLLPEREELAALYGRQARLVAQRCIDDLELIRQQARAAGVATVPTVLVTAAPAKNPAAPRLRTRAERDARPTGHVAVERTMTLAVLLNMLTPGGYSPYDRMYLLDPPAAGARVDPQVRR